MGHPDFGNSHKRLFDTEYERMRHNLLQWLPREDLEKHEEELKEGIFREAVMLQQKMGLALDDYEIIFGGFDPHSAPHGKVTYRNIFNFRRIEGQDISQIYGCVFPSLCRINFRGETYHITVPVFIVDPAPTQSLQQLVEPRTKIHGRESAKLSIGPVTKSNERPSG